MMEIVIQLPRDVNRLCRTCMNIAESPTNTFDNFIVQDNQLTELCKMFESVTSITVSADDGLPETLCSECAEHLKMAYMFQIQCKNIDANLRKLLAMSEESNVLEAKSVIEDDLELTSVLEGSSFSEGSSNKTNFTCHICKKMFVVYYDLSRHMIEHNSNRSLLERFSNSNCEDSKPQNYKNGISVDEDVEQLIEERKLHISENIAELDNGESEHKTPNKQNQIEETILFTNSEMFENIPDDFRTITTLSEQSANNKSMEICCKVCNQNFSSRKELISHICTPLKSQKDVSNDENQLVVTCSLCEKVFPDASELSLHFLKHALVSDNMANTSLDSEFFFCEICGQTLETDSLLQKHYNDKHGASPTWSCSICTVVFENEQHLLKHIEKHPNEKEENSKLRNNFPCVLCNETFPSKATLLKHSVAHLMKKYFCKKCSLSFCTKHSYFAHLKLHPGYQYICSTCGKHLSTKSALKSHIVGVHSVELRHTCATCGKSFATQSRLKTHSQIHTSHKKYVCSYCGYRAHKVGDLQIHTRIHTSERPYKCTFAKCTMSFKTSSHLCDHVRRHLQIRKFQCSICSMGFSTNHGLKIHQMQHTGEKPHACIVCNQKFRRKYHVKVHMKQHNPMLS